MIKIVLGVIVIAAIGAFFLMRNSSEPAPNGAMTMPGTQTGESVTNRAGEAMRMAGNATNTNVKEFTIDSFYDDKGAWFSVKEIRVKKGDTVRINVTNTKGMHDFVIDEYGIKRETPLNQKVAIEFTADKAGTFEYYCSMPGHRARGQFGKLIVE